MRVCTLGNYMPRKCGIATFTFHLTKAITKSFNKQDTMGIIAMNDPRKVYDYSSDVRYSINENAFDEYAKAAEFINHNADILLIQHEFGIFGGKSGLFLLQIIENLNIPYVVTLHTVLERFDFHQEAVMKQLLNEAASIVVMSKLAQKMLEKHLQIPQARIEIIEHGTPDFSGMDQGQLKKELGWTGRPTLITFGLLGRNKGIETVIRALPAICEKVPALQYVVLGKTHPAVVAGSGEEYRGFLRELAEELGVSGHLVFIDEYVSEEDLKRYLKAADYYVTPYLNEAQITSGTLVYALASGSLVFSTPYWHAAEALNPDKGILFGFGNDQEFANLFIESVTQSRKSARIMNNAAQYGYETRWEKAGEKYYHLLQQILQKGKLKHDVFEQRYTLPEISYQHLFHLTDSTGIVQHSNYSVPDKQLGYCLDDNARALIVAIKAYHQDKKPELLRLIHIYLSYMVYMQNEDGKFRNFLDYSKKSHEHAGSEDSFGRTLWALGYLINHPPNDALYQLGLDMFFKALPNVDKLHYLRGLSNSLIGLYWVFKRFPGHELVRAKIHTVCHRLLVAYEEHTRPDWNWFEDIMTYDNAIIPYALMLGAEAESSEKGRSIAFESLDFLTRVTTENGHLSLIGNGSWMKRGAWRNHKGQQPIDAVAMVLAYSKKYEYSRSREDFRKLQMCAEWFLGRNDLLVPLYDKESGGCNDGLEIDGVNRNQGAESLVSWMLAALTYNDYS